MLPPYEAATLTTSDNGRTIWMGDCAIAEVNQSPSAQVRPETTRLQGPFTKHVRTDRIQAT